ncbi:hypothetical protein O6H91_16G090300 [Diphasiastrum complanatum]|uniref:Uncharacterized protein n=2 Tax=Diphasiastrum complanatum TaxID=34168 RepID=A0ACC2BEN6_DIPCM|nr:hypothetical protein O6H91_16G089900 [Diphasiastrum complanatum]KAJ7528224.1 hypothetical protein O6H91_16G090300 [Diphasiastrum complanatum]
MSASRYNLRSTCFEPCPSSQVSKETMDGNVTTLRSTLIQPADTVNRLPAVHESDPFLHNASEVERVASGLEKDASETNRSASKFGHDKTHALHAYGKVIHTNVLQDVLRSFRVCNNTPPPPVPLCHLVLNEAIRTVRKNVLDLEAKFETVGYIKELGSFLVSAKKVGEPKMVVSSVARGQ